MRKFNQAYGPWAVVTGATDGIGLSIAETLAERGLHLVLVGRREHLLKQVCERLESEFHVKTLAIALDVSSADALNHLKSAVDPLDVGLFVAAAGFGSSGEFINLPLVHELNMIDVNCRAVVEQTHYFINKMKTRNQSGIILFSSLVAFQGTPYAATYSATKSFIQNFAEALHHELKTFRIDVMATAPGPVNTGFANRAHMRMKSAANPNDIAVATLAALGSAITVRPGFLAEFLGLSLMTLNRWGRVHIMKKIMSDMVRGFKK